MEAHMSITADFFRNRLDQMIDLRHPLAVLSNRMPWQQKFDTFFQKRFLPQPSLPINSSTCEGFQTEA
jgi:hypothetical protein